MPKKDNPLRKKGDKIEYTQEMLEEYLKCSQDPVYFAQKYVYVIHPDRGKEIIQLYDFQREIIEDMVDSTRYMVKVARQSGKTTVSSVFILWYCLFKKDKFIALVSKELGGAKEILARIKISYIMLPKWLQQGIDGEFGKERVLLENGTSLNVFATESEGVRGRTVSFLYLDEFAIIHKNAADSFMDSVMPAVSASTSAKILITTTPKGKNHFYKMWDSAEKGKSNWDLKAVRWHDIPGRDEAWKEKTIATDCAGDMTKWNQEYECEFEVDTNNSIYRDAPECFDERDVVQSVSFASNEISFYEEIPKYDNSGGFSENVYLMTVDVAAGLGMDYSVIHIIRYNIREDMFYQMGKFSSNKVKQYDLADIINYIINNVIHIDKVLIENNGLAQSTIDRLLNEYDLAEYLTYNTKNRTYGIHSNKQSKLNMVFNLKMLIDKRKISIRDNFTLDELCSFGQVGSKYMGIDAHDDEVTSLYMVTKYLSSPEYKNYKEIRESGGEFDKAETDESITNDNGPIMSLGRKKFGRTTKKSYDYMIGVY